MNIRKVKKTDNKPLAKLIKDVFEEHNAPKEGTVYSDPTTNDLYTLFTSTKKSILWVIEENNQVLGCCGIYPTIGLPKNCIELVKFYFSPKIRGRGLGKKILETTIKSAHELGYTDLYLESLPVFGNAVKMYEKIGFKRLEAPLGESGHTSCNIWMVKKLSIR